MNAEEYARDIISTDLRRLQAIHRAIVAGNLPNIRNERLDDSWCQELTDYLLERVEDICNDGVAGAPSLPPECFDPVLEAVGLRGFGFRACIPVEDVCCADLDPETEAELEEELAAEPEPPERLYVSLCRLLPDDIVEIELSKVWLVLVGATR
jgi:hypothetical protein